MLKGGSFAILRKSFDTLMATSRSRIYPLWGFPAMDASDMHVGGAMEHVEYVGVRVDELSAYDCGSTVRCYCGLAMQRWKCF